MLPGPCLTEECIKRVVTSPDSFITRHLTIRLDPMFQAIQLPACITNLDPSLTDMDGYAFTLEEKNWALNSDDKHSIKFHPNPSRNVGVVAFPRNEHKAPLIWDAAINRKTFTICATSRDGKHSSKFCQNLSRNVGGVAFKRNGRVYGQSQGWTYKGTDGRIGGKYDTKIRRLRRCVKPSQIHCLMRKLGNWAMDWQ